MKILASPVITLSLLILSLLSCNIKPKAEAIRLGLERETTLSVEGIPSKTMKNASTCTASQIKHNDNYYILTAKHCLESRDEIINYFGIEIKVSSKTSKITLKNGMILDLKGIKIATSGDVGIIKLNDEIRLFKTLKLAEKYPSINSDIHMNGFPYGVTDIISVKGKSKQMQIPWYGAYAKLVHLAAAGGYSGGAVLDDSNDIVGILVAGPNDGGTLISFVVPVEIIHGFLGSIE